MWSRLGKCSPNPSGCSCIISNKALFLCLANGADLKVMLLGANADGRKSNVGTDKIETVKAWLFVSVIKELWGFVKVTRAGRKC